MGLDVWMLWRPTITASGLASVWSGICCRNFSNVAAVAVPEWILQCTDRVKSRVSEIPSSIDLQGGFFVLY